MFAAWLWEIEHWHFLLTPAAGDGFEGEFLKMLLPTGRNRQANQTTWKIPLQEAKEQLWLFPHLQINRSFSYDVPFGAGFSLLVCLEVGWCCVGRMVSLVLKYLFKFKNQLSFLWSSPECACSEGSSHTTSTGHTAQQIPALGQIWVQQAKKWLLQASHLKTIKLLYYDFRFTLFYRL